jgi:hypothetical protein
MLAPQCPQEPQFVALQAVIARRAVLGSGNVDGVGSEIDLLPSKAHQLTHPQSMQEGHADHEPVTDGIATLAGGVDQLGNLGFRQILALPLISVFGPTASNCRLFRLRGP